MDEYDLKLEEAVSNALSGLDPAIRERAIRGVVRGYQELNRVRNRVDLEHRVEIIRTNPVTGGANGHQMEEDAKKFKKNRDKRDNRGYKKPYIIMIDIDDFGIFNKVYTQSVGDIVLNKVHEIMRRTLRENDLVTQLADERYGYHLHGEEMSSSYTCRDLEDALKVADKIREAVEEGFDEIKKEVHSKAKSKLKDKHKITVSIGVAEYKVDLEQEDELVEFFDAKNRADRYMQVAKKEMKNFVYSGDDDFLFPNKPGLYNAVEDLTKMIEMYTTRVPQRIIGRFGRKLSKVVSRYRRFKKTSRD